MPGRGVTSWLGPDCCRIRPLRMIQAWRQTDICGSRMSGRLHMQKGLSHRKANPVGLAPKLLRMCSKATKHGVAFRIGLAAKLLRMRSQATKDDLKNKRNSRFFFSWILRDILSSFASEPLWFATHALVVFHELLSSFASKSLWFATRALVVFRDMLSSFTSKPLPPHVLVNLSLRHCIGGAYAQSLGGPKAPKPEPQISGTLW